jgi:PilZ domain
METRQSDVTVPLRDANPPVDRNDAEEAQEDYLDRRRAERAPIDCPICFISEERGDDGSKRAGKLLDLSKTGCRIFSLQPPAPGSQITLILSLPDGMPPIRLIGTTVRHVCGHEFGAEFLPLTSEERRRVQAIIFKHVTWSAYSLRRPAFQIF